MINRFKSVFREHVCEGDKISAYIDGVDYVARIHRDNCLDSPDERQDGFYPSLNSKDAGYIGPKSQKELDIQMKHAKSVMRAWKNDDWFYCGIVLSVEVCDRMIEKHAGSLWGIECNYPAQPRADKDGYPNEYLTEVANELLEEYLHEQKKESAA